MCNLMHNIVRRFTCASLSGVHPESLQVKERTMRIVLATHRNLMSQLALSSGAVDMDIVWGLLGCIGVVIVLGWFFGWFKFFS